VFSRAPDSAAKSFLYSAVFWLLAGSTAWLVAWLKLIDPDFLSTKVLSYPRVRAVASLSLVYGWLLLSALATIFYVMPRVTGARMRSERGGQTSAWLINIGLSLAIVLTLLNGVAGHEFLELPRWLGWVLVVSLSLNALNVVRTIERRTEKRLYASVWYFVGAIVWAPLVIAAGVLPSFAGVRDSIAHLFGVGALMNAVIPAVAVGAIYYVVPRATGRPLYSHQLALLGFWWLAFIGPLGGQARHIFGPSQDWVQTLAITGSIGMLLPVITVVVNVFGTLRGGWDKVPDHPSVRLAVGGTVAWAVAVLQGTALSFRSVARIVGSTTWVTTQVWLLVIAFTLCLTATITFAFPRLVGRRWHRRDRVTAHFWLTVMGATLVALGGLGAGIVAGTIWQTGAVLGKTTGIGKEFSLVLEATDRFVAVAVVGVLLFLVAQWIFASNLFRSTTLGEPGPIEVVAPEQDEPDPSAARIVRVLAVAAVGVFLASFGVAYAAPIADRELGTETDYSIAYPAQTRALDGKAIYTEEGCWYCHTQSVRPVPADVGLGTVTTPDRVARDVPSVLGLVRIGPDLACVGGRFESAAAISDHLRSPRSQRPASVMPRYDFLTDRQMESLVAYLMQLKCQANA
jgi:cbb3-type cytochrome oxidase subunit 1